MSDASIDAGTVSASELEGMLAHLPAAAYLCDRDGLITYFNDHAQRLWGRAPKLNDPVDRFCGSFRLFTSKGTPIAHDDCWMARALRENTEFEACEILVERANGERLTALAHAKPIRDKNGDVAGGVNVLIDISDRKQNELVEARLAAIVESSDDAIVSKTLEGIILSWNAAAERVFGYTAAEAVGQSITLIIPPDRLAEEREILARLRRGERIDHFETIRMAKSGRLLDISLTVSPIRDSAGTVVGVSKIARDVTERKLADAKIRQSEQRFAEFMHNLPGLAWIKSVEGRYVYVNDAASVAFGRPSPELLGKTDDELFPPGTAEQFRTNDRQVLAGGTGVRTIETLTQVDGLHHSIVSKFPIPAPDGGLAFVGGMAIDITERIKAETALRESEERFRNVADHAPVLIWINGQRGCEFVNAEYLRFVGAEADDVLGMKWADRIHPEDLDRYLDAYGRAVAKMAPFEADVRLRRADGEYRWLHSRGVPRMDGDEKFLGYVGCSADIHDARRAAENLTAVKEELATQLSDLGRLHEMSVRLSKTLDLDEIVYETLRTAVALHGGEKGLVSLSDAAGESLRVAASLGFEEEFLESIASVRTGSGACGSCLNERRRVVIEDTETDPRFDELRAAARKAGFRAVHSTPLVTRSGRMLGVLSIHFSRPRLPTDRETHLIDLCARQAADFLENARLYEELRDADRRKDDFLAMLAHELRNPLAPISNSLQLLRRGDEIGPAGRGVLEIMEQQVRHLVRLVDDLLEVSRISRGKIELRRETLDLSAAIRSAVETSRPWIEGAKHDLEITLPSAPLLVEADAVRMGQVIANLLNNAAKYTNSGGEISIAARREGATAVISVRDNGLGIPPEVLPRVFERFSQVNRHLNRSQGGLGLGLSVAKSLVEMHGGTIEARSAGAGSGSENSSSACRSPRRRRQSTARRESRRPNYPAREILVVDDARAASFVLGKLLQTMGQNVRTAGDGGAALALIKEKRPDIIISDIGMPGMDGYELARRLRGEPELQNVTLVALTGYGQETDRQRAREAGFDLHLVKPVSAEALENLLATRGSG